MAKFYIMSCDGDFYRPHRVQWDHDENWTINSDDAHDYESIEKALSDLDDLKESVSNDMCDCSFCIVDENYKKVI